MSRLNYHHLHYFWAVAKKGNLTRAAAHLRVSQSALSTQIKQLEQQVGHDLFLRQGRSLALTEAGHIALEFAERIFATGSELVATLRDGSVNERQALRIGAAATLSRNFQNGFVRPLLDRTDVELVLQSGSLAELLPRLAAHTLDLVLSNHAVQGDVQNAWRCQRIARQAVSLVGPPRLRSKAFRFPDDLAQVPLILPSTASDIRTGFDLLCERLDVRFAILAEVDDMAMLRLLALGAATAAAVVPTVVVRDELRDGRLQKYCELPNLYESFFAISVKRHYQHPLLKSLLARSEADLLTARPMKAQRE